MDFELSAEQRTLVESVRTLVARHAGTERAREVGRRSGYDTDLMAALEQAGFTDFALAGAGPLEAVLAVEEVTRAAGSVPYAALALVGPHLPLDKSVDVIALATLDPEAPVRFGAEADVIVRTDGERVVLCAARPGVEPVPVESDYGYPVAIIVTDDGIELDPDDAESILAWWRVALAAEIVGAVGGALDLTVGHLKERRQFGRPLASLQAVQHRLAELKVDVECASWLTRHAAWSGAPPAYAAEAATMATAAAAAAMQNTHQLTGAIGLTYEYDLYLWTLRLQGLRLELGGLAGHAVAAARHRWRSTPSAAVRA